MKLSCTPGKTYWGLALAWYGDYTQGGVADVYENRMNFLEKYGMKCFMGTPEEIDNLPETAVKSFLSSWKRAICTLFCIRIFPTRMRMKKR